jgi:hypothetical protein
MYDNIKGGNWGRSADAISRESMKEDKKLVQIKEKLRQSRYTVKGKNKNKKLAVHAMGEGQKRVGTWRRFKRYLFGKTKGRISISTHRLNVQRLDAE